MGSLLKESELCVNSLDSACGIGLREFEFEKIPSCEFRPMMDKLLILIYCTLKRTVMMGLRLQSCNRYLLVNRTVV